MSYSGTCIFTELHWYIYITTRIRTTVKNNIGEFNMTNLQDFTFIKLKMCCLIFEHEFKMF